MIRFLRLEGQFRVPQDYERDVTKAELTFAHQRVFDPIAKRTVHLSPPSSALLANIPVEDALSFAGPCVPQLRAMLPLLTSNLAISPMTLRLV